MTQKMKYDVWSTLRPFIVTGVFIAVLIGVAIWYAFDLFPDSKEKRVAFVATNLLSILALAVIITQAIIYYRQWKAMQAHEARMIEQRDTMEKQFEAAERQASTASAQVAMMREGISQTKVLIEQNADVVSAAKRQAQAAEQNLEQTRDHFDSVERPSIGQNDETLLIQLPTGEWKFRFGIQNSGKRPAVSIVSQFAVGIGPHSEKSRCPDPQQGERAANALDSRGILPINGKMVLESIAIADEAYQRHMAGEHEIFLWVYVTYKKTLDQETPYIFEYYARVETDGYFSICDTHNNAT